MTRRSFMAMIAAAPLLPAAAPAVAAPIDYDYRVDVLYGLAIMPGTGWRFGDPPDDDDPELEV